MSQAEPTSRRKARDATELAHSLEYVARAKRGDREALEALMSRYQDRVRRIVRIRMGSRLRSQVESMDIVQETFLTAVKKLGDFEPRDHASILQWLSRIACNQIHGAHDYHTAQRRDQDRCVPLVDEDLTARQTLPEEHAQKAEVRELLDEAMAQLPDDYREVVLLRDYCDGEWEFVAAQLGRPTAEAARELHRRAWIKLRRIVGPKLGGSRGQRS